MKFFTKEIKIAITAVVAVVIVYAGIILLKGLKLFNTDNEYTVIMDNVDGISISSEVLANGLKVGYVKDIRYNQAKQNLALSLCVEPDFHVPTGTTVYVSKELLGASRLNFALGKPTAPDMASGDTIYGSASNDLMAAAGNLVPQIEQMLPKIDSILSSLNRLTSDPALTASLHNIEQTTAHLSTTTAELNRLMRSDVPEIMASARETMSNTNELTAKLNRIDIEGIATQAQQTISHANSSMEHLNTALHSKDNSLGILLNDNAFALHLDSTVVNASLLLEDLRLHPKRYVHFSLFGKKDK